MFAKTTEIHLLTSLGARAYYMHSCLHDWPNYTAHDFSSPPLISYDLRTPKEPIFCLRHKLLAQIISHSILL